MEIVRSLVLTLYILAFSISARLLYTSSCLSPSTFIRGPRSLTHFRPRISSTLLDLQFRLPFFHHRSGMHESTVPTKRPLSSTFEPSPKSFKIDAAENKKRFFEVFPDVVDELLEILKVAAMPDEIVAWYERVRT